ncbi:hypothetical protein Tco_1325099 [Tanacetum coccineum]
MSDSEHSTVLYTYISSDSDPSAWAIPLMDASELPEMDPYEEVAQQGQEAPPLPAYVPDPMELEHHVPVYVPEHVYPEYLVPSDDDIPVEDPEEDPIDYVVDADNGEDEEEESSKDDDDDEEEHLAHAGSTVVSSPAVDLVPSAEETEPFETDESAVTPPPPPTYRTTSRIFVRSQTPIPFHYEAEVARILALPTPSLSLLTPLSSPLPQIPPPPTSLTYAQALLGCRATMMRAASPPTHHPLTLPAPSTSCRADIIEVTYCLGRSYYLLLSHIDRRTMAAIEVVNLRVSYQANVYRRESEEFYTRHQDAQGDRAPLRDEVDTLRIYISSLCTTHEQERVEARQALDSSEAHNRALEARIAVLETQARERIDTLEDTVSSA